MKIFMDGKVICFQVRDDIIFLCPFVWTFYLGSPTRQPVVICGKWIATEVSWISASYNFYGERCIDYTRYLGLKRSIFTNCMSLDISYLLKLLTLRTSKPLLNFMCNIEGLWNKYSLKSLFVSYLKTLILESLQEWRTGIIITPDYCIILFLTCKKDDVWSTVPVMCHI